MSHLFAGRKQEIRREKTSGRTATLNEAVICEARRHRASLQGIVSLSSALMCGVTVEQPSLDRALVSLAELPHVGGITCEPPARTPRDSREAQHSHVAVGDCRPNCHSPLLHVRSRLD